VGTRKNDILQGTLALLILKTLLGQKRMHGYAITAHIREVSDQLLRVEEDRCTPRCTARSSTITPSDRHYR
jgi:PadR family transcriptional regulator PadR